MPTVADLQRVVSMMRSGAQTAGALGKLGSATGTLPAVSQGLSQVAGVAAPLLAAAGLGIQAGNPIPAIGSLAMAAPSLTTSLAPSYAASIGLSSNPYSMVMALPAMLHAFQSMGDSAKWKDRLQTRGQRLREGYTNAAPAMALLDNVPMEHLYPLLNSKFGGARLGDVLATLVDRNLAGEYMGTDREAGIRGYWEYNPKFRILQEAYKRAGFTPQEYAGDRINSVDELLANSTNKWQAGNNRDRNPDTDDAIGNWNRTLEGLAARLEKANPSLASNLPPEWTYDQIFSKAYRGAAPGSREADLMGAQQYLSDQRNQNWFNPNQAQTPRTRRALEHRNMGEVLAKYSAEGNFDPTAGPDALKIPEGQTWNPLHHLMVNTRPEEVYGYQNAG